MTDEPTEEEPSRLRSMMEEANARAATAERQLADLNRREMFRDAGLDPTNKQHAAFIRAYDGDLSSDAVNAYVSDLGVNQAPEPPVPVTPTNEQDALIRIAEAARDAGTPPPGPDAVDRATKALQEAVARKAPIHEIDRLSIDVARATGQRTVLDL